MTPLKTAFLGICLIMTFVGATLFEECQYDQ